MHRMLHCVFFFLLLFFKPSKKETHMFLASSLNLVKEPQPCLNNDMKTRCEEHMYILQGSGIY